MVLVIRSSVPSRHLLYPGEVTGYALLRGIVDTDLRMIALADRSEDRLMNKFLDQRSDPQIAGQHPINKRGCYRTITIPKSRVNAEVACAQRSH